MVILPSRLDLVGVRVAALDMAAITEGTAAALLLAAGLATALAAYLTRRLRREMAGRARAEERLERSRGQLAEVQRVARVGSWELDLTTGVVTMSGELCRICGLDPAGIEGTTHAAIALVHPKDRAHVLRALRGSLEHRLPFSFFHRVVTPGGEVRTLQARGGVVLGDGGRPVRMIGLGQDVTEQVRTQDRLRASEESLRQLADNLDDVLWTIDPRDGRVTYVSPGYERIWGRSVEGPYQDPLDFLQGVHPDDRHGVEAAMACMLRGHPAGGRVPGGAVRRVRPLDPEPGVPGLDRRGRLHRIGGLARDVTERRAAHEALRARDEERRALLARLVSAQEEERRRIAVGIHEDTLQVMAAVDIGLQTVHSLAAGSDAARVLGELDCNVALAIDRLRRMVFELRPPALDRAGLAQAIRMYLARTAPELEYRMVDRMVVEPPLEVRAGLYRIAQEALLNVRKHAGARHVEIVIEPREGGCHVAVRDDGAGFCVPEHRPAAGHVGIAAMRERAEMAGGWWRIDSAPGAGTCVEFWVPIEPAVLVHEPPARESMSPARG